MLTKKIIWFTGQNEEEKNNTNFNYKERTSQKKSYIIWVIKVWQELLLLLNAEVSNLMIEIRLSESYNSKFLFSEQIYCQINLIECKFILQSHYEVYYETMYKENKVIYKETQL
ncbi:unnamed protein product (macronuclear) [Paramecium tetraurelia]|uniref:Uncharacterized protein n=1 Tax=Paramecium tetraurelia TaxID=5888 RepID=A0C3U0_PARTE|nr:uncharacterized protein GSPATT00034936001 [Paramecium tetraurelia]CAK65457.1 unnamed protein product [Paramecium tetraurelia]|eukprot:XP_001432854.1 hypothetical protein (macronuclear) [Paramecium tetraurelia strain d4-2]